MKKNIFILFFSLLLWAACDDPLIEKPKNLIREDRMIDMLVDVHLAEATYQNRIRQDSAIDNKYQVADSTFEKSYIFYLSNPKKFEKMYRKVQSKLSEMEQEFSGRKNEMLEFEDEN